MVPPTDPTFLAPPGDITDWRLVMLYDAAAATGIVGHLPGSPRDLANELGLDPHGVRVLLDALVVWGVVQSKDGSYDLGTDAPDATRAAAMRHHARALRGWGSSLERRLHGSAGTDRPVMATPDVFHDALAASARKAAPALVDLCLQRFPGTGSVLDLGGLHGEYSLEFARRGLRVTMQDLPEMIELVRARGQLADAGIELVAGSFFDFVPDGPFDLAFCTGITHTFDADHNVTLFKNLRPVIAPGGGVAVTTFMRGRHPIADVFAVQMFVNGAGGDSHDDADYRAWLGRAGFSVDPGVVDLPDRPQSVLFAT
ncbi:MAG: hypothetical protein NVS3B12_15120 [Acidimicrobiales bacterium]